MHSYLSLNCTFSSRQVSLCRVWRAALYPSVFWGGGPRTERCIGPSSSSCGPSGRRIQMRSSVLLPPITQPQKSRNIPCPSVLKREGKRAQLWYFPAVWCFWNWPNSHLQTCLHCAVLGKSQHRNGNFSSSFMLNNFADISLLIIWCDPQFGGKEVLQHAIPQVLKKGLPTKVMKAPFLHWHFCKTLNVPSLQLVSQEVLFDMKETHLTCTDKNSTMVSQYNS